jgi:hypothetical protein
MRGSGLMPMEIEAVAFLLGCVMVLSAAVYAFCRPSALSVCLLLVASLFLCAATGAFAFHCGEEFQKDRDDIGDD